MTTSTTTGRPTGGGNAPNSHIMTTDPDDAETVDPLDEFELAHPHFNSIREAREYFERPLAWHGKMFPDDPIGEFAQAARRGQPVQVTPADEDSFGIYETMGREQREVNPETSDFPGHPLLLRAGLTMNTGKVAPYYGVEYQSGFDHFFGPYYLGYLVAVRNGTYTEPEYVLIHESGTIVATNLTRIFPTERFEEFREDRFVAETPNEYKLLSIAADDDDVYGVTSDTSAFDATLRDAPTTRDRALQLRTRLPNDADFTNRVFALTDDEFDVLCDKIERLNDQNGVTEPLAKESGIQTRDSIDAFNLEFKQERCPACSTFTRPIAEFTREKFLTVNGTSLTRVGATTTTVCRKCLRSIEIPTLATPNDSDDEDDDTTIDLDFGEDESSDEGSDGDTLDWAADDPLIDDEDDDDDGAGSLFGEDDGSADTDDSVEETNDSEGNSESDADEADASESDSESEFEADGLDVLFGDDDDSTFTEESVDDETDADPDDDADESVEVEPFPGDFKSAATLHEESSDTPTDVNESTSNAASPF